MMTAISWILWVIVALNACCWLLISFGQGDPGGRWTYRVQGAIWLLGVVVTAMLPVSKFHLVWVYVVGAMVPYAVMHSRTNRALYGSTSPLALIMKKHLEEESGGEVWNLPEMRRSFRVYESTPPDEFARTLQSGEFSCWWVAKEPCVGKVRVIRRADQVKGSLLFKDRPRFYFNWTPD